MDQLTVLIADDHDLIRRGVRDLLAARSGWQVVGEACNGTDAVRKAVSLKPDIAILDFSMPELNGPGGRSPDCGEGSRDRRRSADDARFRTSDAGGAAGRGARAGAEERCGPRPNRSSRGRREEAALFHDATIGTGAGRIPGRHCPQREGEEKAAQLTERECEVMRLLADGMSSKEAAARLQISIRTVESHRINISRKLGFNSIAKLVHYAIRHGIVAHS